MIPDELVVFLHIICGTILVITLLIMQLAIGPALAKIPGGKEKKDALAVIHRRWRPVVDIAIIILTLSALYLLFTRWIMIVSMPLFYIKLPFAVITLFLANALHFYYRRVKQKLIAQGKKERLDNVNRLTMMMERIALVTGTITFLLGISFNHL